MSVYRIMQSRDAIVVAMEKIPRKQRG